MSFFPQPGHSNFISQSNAEVTEQKFWTEDKQTYA